MKKLIPLLVVGLCAQAGAQDFGSAVNAGLQQFRFSPVPAVVARGAAIKKMNGALDQTLTAMNDGPEVGGEVVAYVKDHQTVIRFEDAAAKSRLENGEIVLDMKMVGTPRALGPRIAWEASSLMLADMPDCSEKEYMRRSIATRVWLELGGEQEKLPVVEPLTGDKDEDLAREMKLWLEPNAQMALYKIGEATKKPSVQDLEAAEKDPAKKAALFDADARFTQFLAREREWRMANAR